jgi:hypothetical protein
MRLPAAHLERPTPKALSEHWHKLKKDLKKANDDAGGPDGGAPSSAPSSAPRTPASARAPRAPRTPAGRATNGRAGGGGRGKASGGSSGRKRLRANDSDDEESDDKRGPHLAVRKREADELAADAGFGANPFAVTSPGPAAAAAAAAGARARTATPGRSQRAASMRASVVIKREASMTEPDDSDDGFFDGVQNTSMFGELDMPDLTY